MAARLRNQQIPSLPAAVLQVFQFGSIRSQEIGLGRAASFLQSQELWFACSHPAVPCQLNSGMQSAACCCCCSKELSNLNECWLLSGNQQLQILPTAAECFSFVSICSQGIKFWRVASLSQSQSRSQKLQFACNRSQNSSLGWCLSN